jgi:signal transduction histidine kinase
LAAANRPISFVMEGEEREATLGPAVRREVFLVFKEALNNAVRHAGFTKCTTWLSIDRGWITLRVSDDGKGFDPRKCKAGNGLESLRRRAARLGGTLLIESSPGAGAIVELRVPAG